MNTTKSYYGGKGSDGTFQTIINNIPQCELFVETHAGMAKITEYMNHSGITILNDINKNVCDELKEKFSNRLIKCDTVLKYPTIDWFSSIKENVCRYRNKEKCGSGCQIIIEKLDAIELIEKYKEVIEGVNSVVFSDPPYPLDTRKSQRLVYEFEMTDLQHEVLIVYLRKIRCKQLITTYPNPIYQNGLSDYNLIEYFSQTRKGKALENLYYNFEPPEVLNDPQYLGKDYRERERLKKIKDNFIRKFKEFPIQLQHSILSEL